MLLCSPKKNHPCEGCRERKKKCSGEYPCARCHRLGNECVFLRPTLPPDHAYVDLLQEQELSLEVDTLNSALVDMEQTMIQLRRNTHEYNNSNSSFQRRQQLTSRRRQQQQQQQNMMQNWQLILGRHGVTVNTSIKSYSDLLKQVQLWQQACQSYTTPPLFRSPSSPFPSSDMVLHRQLPLWLLRRGYYMAITVCVQSHQKVDHSLSATTLITTSQNQLSRHYHEYTHYQQQQPSPPLSENEAIQYSDSNDTSTSFWATLAAAAPYNDDPDQLCRHILDTFFACYIVRYTFLHQSTFYRLFITPLSSTSTSLLDSPVICAVCAVALTVRCRHMLPLLPYQHHAQLADIMYRRARDLMDFDEPTLATFIILTFLAMYKQMIFCVEDATFYLDMAFRTRCLLVDDDNNDNDSESDDEKRGECELIKRLHWALWETQTSVEYYKNQRGVPQSTKTKPRCSLSSCCSKQSENPIVTLLKEKRYQYTRHALPDEPPAIHRALRNAFYRAEMMAAQGPFLGQVRFGNNDTFAVNYLAETDYRFNKAYQNIPTDCQLPSNILEEGLSDSEFRQRLDALWSSSPGPRGSKNIDRMAALQLTIQYFQGVISLYEPFLPDLKDRQRAQDAGLLKNDGDTPCFTSSPSSPSSPLPSSPSLPPPTTTTTKTDNNTTSNYGSEDTKVTMHQLRAQQKCTHAATIIVRLLNYQRSLPGHCRVNVHVLLTAWDIHMRNACLGMTLPPDDGTTTTDNNKTMYFECLSLSSIYQARQSLLQCLSILREGYLFNFAEHAIWKYYEHVEQVLLSSLSVSSPTAAHWIPC